MSAIEREIHSWLSIPRGDWLVSQEDLKRKWKDYPDWNEIFFELITPEEYDDAICSAIQRFNGTNPYSAYNPKDFPYIHRYLLLDMAMYETLNDIILYKIKNHLSASNAGLEVTIHNNVQFFLQERERLFSITEAKISEVKSIESLNQCNGSIFHYAPIMPYGSF